MGKNIPDEDFFSDPFLQFAKWYGEAEKLKVKEPNAMAFATVDSYGHPSLRMVLLKGFNSKGFVFFTNYESRKGKQLLLNPYAALTFYWKEQERQIRLEGKVKKISARESDHYFQTRSLESRINACISPQSCLIPDRTFLEVLGESLIWDLNGKSPSRPDTWGGYCLFPHRIEFWQGRPHRLHDRICYTLKQRTWIHVRLAP